jgi:hypothetical protein
MVATTASALEDNRLEFSSTGSLILLTSKNEVIKGSKFLAT